MFFCLSTTAISVYIHSKINSEYTQNKQELTCQENSLPEKPPRRYFSSSTANSDWLASEDIVNFTSILQKHYLIFFPFSDPVQYLFLFSVPGRCIFPLKKKRREEILDAHRRNINTFAFTFNLPPHHVVDQNTDAKHWTAFTITIQGDQMICEFFNSFGTEKIYKDSPTAKAIDLLVNSFKHIFPKKLILPLQCYKTRKQQGNTECAIYCLWYFQQKAKNKSFAEIENYPIDDKMCRELRRMYFS